MRRLPLLMLAFLMGAAAVLCICTIWNEEAGGPGRDARSALLASSGERLLGETWKTEEQRKAQAAAEAEEQRKAQAEAEAEEQRKAQAEAEKETPKVRVVLDPGHGGPGVTDEQELGAIYRDTYEKYLTLEIAKALGEALSAYGNVEIFYTRETDKAMTLKERAAYAASVDADVLISLHLNASEEHNLFGSEVFVSAYDAYYAYGEGLGVRILSELSDYGFASKGVKTRLGSKGDYYGIIRECRSLGIPAIIVEHGYMDEDRDWARMDSAEELRSLGRRDAAGIAAFFGLEKGKELTGLSEPELSEPAASLVQPDVTAPENVWYTLEKTEDGTAEISLYAREPESRLMYYDYSLDGGNTWKELELWTGEDRICFSVDMESFEEDALVIRVYNNYELRTEAKRL